MFSSPLGVIAELEQAPTLPMPITTIKGMDKIINYNDYVGRK